ncbi:MAG: small multi-drug export protein [Clostridia bacterium]|nr:small multi-drug export protein [Clostridia bacterium]
MLEQIQHYLYVFFCSMVPLIELRGAIPIGAALGLPWLANFALSIIGNMIPIPFILLFIRHILAWMKTTKHFSKIALWLEEKAEKNKGKVMKYATFGLALFVGIPLPGTGAWTGALVAALMNMRMKYSLPSIFAGVVLAAFIMSGISYGFLSFLSFLA